MVIAVRRIEESALLSRWSRRTCETGVLCGLLVVCGMVVPAPSAGVAVVGVCVLFAAIAGVDVLAFLRRLSVGAGFATVSLLPLSVGLRWGADTRPYFDVAGFETGLLALARAMATLSATLLLAFTTPFPRLLGVLRAMRIHQVVLELLATVHREIFLLDETFSRLARSLACRDGWGANASGRRTLSLGAAALFVRALERSERSRRGMASRGFPDGPPRQGISDLEFRPLALLGAIVVPVLLLTWMFTEARLHVR